VNPLKQNPAKEVLEKSGLDEVDLSEAHEEMRDRDGQFFDTEDLTNDISEQEKKGDKEGYDHVQRSRPMDNYRIEKLKKKEKKRRRTARQALKEHHPKWKDVHEMYWSIEETFSELRDSVAMLCARARANDNREALDEGRQLALDLGRKVHFIQKKVDPAVWDYQGKVKDEDLTFWSRSYQTILEVSEGLTNEMLDFHHRLKTLTGKLATDEEIAEFNEKADEDENQEEVPSNE